MPDTDRLPVRIHGLEAVEFKQVAVTNTATATNEELHKLLQAKYSKLWIPRAALHVGETILLPDHTEVRVRRVVWLATELGHQSEPAAEVHVIKE